MDVLSEVDEEEIAEVLSTWTGIPVFKLTEEETEAAPHGGRAPQADHQPGGLDQGGQQGDPPHPGRPEGPCARPARSSSSAPRASGRPSSPRRSPSSCSATRTRSCSSTCPSTWRSTRQPADRIASGYVGYEEGGQLTEAVRRKPFSVILFDEIEKAHPDVFNTLLQILEDGRLTDSQGHQVDFKNTVIIMTSNLGTRDIQKGPGIGFVARPDEKLTYERMKDRVMDELKKSFRPEFLNRIDEVIVFHSLSPEDVKQIVDLMMKRVTEQLKAKDLEIELPTPRRPCSPRRATTPRSARGRSARSSGSSRTRCPRSRSGRSSAPVRP